MDIYLPGAAVTSFGTFAAGINLGVSETVAGHLALYHGAVAYTPGSHPRVLDAQKAAAVDALVSPDGIPQNIAIAGDSIAAQNSTIITGAYSTMARGPVMWMLSKLGHSWDYQPTDNFSVGGVGSAGLLNDQLPLLLAAHRTRRYTRVFLSVGTNDTQNLVPVADIKRDLLLAFQALRGAGIIPVHTGIRPRGVDAAITTAKKQNTQLNEWLYQLSLTGQIEYIPVAEVYADTSTAFGNTVAALMYDGLLHPNARGAALEGAFMADYYISRGVRPGIVFATQQSDAFDRSDNPRGVAFAAANPLLIGGTTQPTGMTTVGGAWSNVGRTLANGQTRADRTCVLAPSTAHYLNDDWVKVGPWLATDLQPGDIIEARALVILAGAVDVQSVTLRLDENDGSGNKTHWALSSSESANLVGDHVLYLKTPMATVREYFGSGNASIFARPTITTGASGSGTAIVRALEVRKVA